MEETFTLNNGVKMPEIGLGTFRMSSSAAQGAVEAALADGYHLIDTAEAYYNEDGVGRGIKNSGVNREDLFVSTKLWTSSYNDPDELIRRWIVSALTTSIFFFFTNQLVIGKLLTGL